ncbi:hypothetical protein F443_02108 [Phytophthora nicotianae P1569]|uniref:Uncharacterized protein n=1 Tax=Phytophthora nicotianae P1569 TaxID=1317065 RepID=V9FUN8_PHYNI|nr:hypothetical protein F443_02108 [Phytophthora nicotianae P1569]
MYKEFKVDFTRAQALKVLQGKPVRLSADQLGKGHSHNFHPENYKKLMKARQAHKGLTLSMTHVGEPELAVPARAGLKALTGVGMEQDTEGDRLTLKDVRQGASRACTYAKKRGIVTDVVDAEGSVGDTVSDYIQRVEAFASDKNEFGAERSEAQMNSVLELKCRLYESSREGLLKKILH